MVNRNKPKEFRRCSEHNAIHHLSRLLYMDIPTPGSHGVESVGHVGESGNMLF